MMKSSVKQGSCFKTCNEGRAVTNAIKFRPVFLEKNSGHGNARRIGLAECRNDLVALMDADDISLIDRFEKQILRFAVDPALSIVGGQISEFTGAPDQIIGIRQVPQNDDEIKRYLKKRCPMNQVSVMFRKKEVERAGGYIDWYCEEDYYLWARMALAGCRFANVPDNLVNVRVGDEMSARRGGLRYFKSEARMQKFLYDKKITNLHQYLYNVVLRFVGEVVIPDAVRTKLFRLFRTDVQQKEGHREQNQRIKNDDPTDANYPPFSVSMCVYGGDNAMWFDTALESIIHQTVPPQEIVLVVDGPVPQAIHDVINKYEALLAGGGNPDRNMD